MIFVIGSCYLARKIKVIKNNVNANEASDVTWNQCHDARQSDDERKNLLVQHRDFVNVLSWELWFLLYKQN